MTHLPHRGRPLAVLASLALGATVLLGFAPSAQAIPLQGQFVVQTSFGTTGGAACTLTTDTSDSYETAFAAGAARSGSFSSTATAEDSGDAADDTALAAKASGRVQALEAGGSLRSLTLSASLSASMVAAQGLATSCDSSASTLVGTQTIFTLARPGWLTLRGSVSRSTEAELQLSSAASQQGAFAMSVGLKYDQTRRFFLAAGTYQVLGTFELEVESPQVAGDPTSAAGAGSMSLTFTAAGDAVAATAGSGRSLLSLDGALSCGARSVAGAFVGKAGRVRSAAFFVNGRRAKVVRAPHRGDDVVLRGLSPVADTTVTAVLTMRKGRPKTVTRSYVSCA
ncbi:hypothetical protein [Nocardioides sp. 503]|uniref:hypothetical protein n=1 Tax=Nocardioides sp. 503 TaxID=2508326 RepID=UPI00106F8422|nr:hypothetical protein [Nocardioides sp. 503]